MGFFRFKRRTNTDPTKSTIFFPAYARRNSDTTNDISLDQRKVSFRDQKLGLTPRHVVTDIHHRPRTTEDEKQKLFYNLEDIAIFEQEELYEKIEQEIQEVERQKQAQKENGHEGPVIVKVTEEMKFRNLVRKVERHKNY